MDGRGRDVRSAAVSEGRTVNIAAADALLAGIRTGPSGADSRSRHEQRLQVIEYTLFGLVPLVGALALLIEALVRSSRAFDFQYAYSSAGHAVLAGTSPYQWTVSQVHESVAFVYPALSAVLFAPFALLPDGFGSALLATVLCVAATPLILWALDVRDWRVYGIVLLWMPVYGSWQTANETIFLVLMVALAWRYRDRPFVAGLLTAAAISLKPFIWPLALWLLATRRWRAAVEMLVCGLALNVLAWSVIGFGQIHAYLHIAALDTRYAWNAGYSVAAVLSHFGAGQTLGDAVCVLISLALAAGVIRAGFLKRDERQALVLTVALMLVASPLVWSHYFALLLVPVAIRRPRLAWPWAMPLLLWVCRPPFQVTALEEVVVWSAVTAMLVSVVRTARA